ncbi:hypothetical protein Tco_0705989 [Tanacetum coccineum]|uniref:Uncharacterized protein n=1 Tax=Tanacetum coccineum TaxID=301880 RepID=A0ABQ4Y7P1_9ASTR
MRMRKTLLLLTRGSFGLSSPKVFLTNELFISLIYVDDDSGVGVSYSNGPLVNFSRQPTHPPKESVFATGVNVGGSLRLSNTLSTGVPESYPRTIRHVEEGESSRNASVYIPRWNIPRRCHVDTLEWCRELMTHLAHPAAQEESNALTNEAARIVSLEVELAKKDYTLTYSDRLLAEGARERERLIVQLGQAEIEKFDCIWKLLPIVVGRLLKSHEYKESLLGPFNMAIQAGWGKGLSEGCTDEEIMVALSWVEEFDAYLINGSSIRMYDKLFEKQYPYVQKIARGYRHSVADLLKVYLDPAPSQGTSNPNTSKAFGRSNPPLPKKT